MNLEFTTIDRIGKLLIKGRLDASNANELKEKFNTYIEEVANFVFDCSELEFVDSTGLGAIISCTKRASVNNGDIYIANLQDKPRMLFEVTRAYKMFEVFDDVDSAIEEFKSNLN